MAGSSVVVSHLQFGYDHRPRPVLDSLLTTLPCKTETTYLETQIHIKQNVQPSQQKNAKYLYNIYTMLDQRRRRWAVVV